MYFVLAEVDLVGWVDAILSVLAILVAILMTFFILLQEGKGGGLAALGGTKAAGVEGVTNPIRKATGYLAAMFFVMIIILGVLHKPKESVLGTVEPKPDAAKAESTTDTKTDSASPSSETAKPADTAKPAETAKPADAKPADVKGDASKPAEKPADAAKPAEPKSSDAKAAETKAAEPAKSDAPKPVQDDTKKADPKPDGK